MAKATKTSNGVALLNGTHVADNGRISFSKIPRDYELPDLLDVQLKSFQEFLQEGIPIADRIAMGLESVFQLNFPIIDSRETFTLEYLDYRLEKPRYSVQECQERGLTYSVPLKARLRLSSKNQDEKSEDFVETVEQEVFLGNLPQMTERGTFIINGAERVVVSQLHRSPGVFFGESLHPNGTPIYSGRVIPFRGSWVEFTTDINNVLWAYIDRKKKFPVTMLLRALGWSSDEDILQLFGLVHEVDVKSADLPGYIGKLVASDVIDMNTGEIFLSKDSTFTEESVERLKSSGVRKIKFMDLEDTGGSVILNTIAKDPSRSTDDAYEAIYRVMRSSEAPDMEAARGLLEKLFFNQKRYDLGLVGRIRLNQKLHEATALGIPNEITTLTKEDIVEILKYIIRLQLGKAAVDDIDHLGNRRVRTVGEQLAQQFNIGLARMARTIRERMSIHDEKVGPADLVNARTVTSVINTFFGTNQLSQFMDQTNPLAEMTHKRRMSALGPGGLTRERAGFEVRDVHYTHYGRLCPIETPEGPNIGLISSLSVYARVNEFGFLETPYRMVKNGKVSSDITYLTADDEEDKIIAQANHPLDEKGHFVGDRISARQFGDFIVVAPDVIQYMDVAPSQIVSAAAALVPFLEHDDANRALMGSNMQRQAVPLLRPEAPLVGTGFEGKIARDSRALILAERDGIVEAVDAERILMVYDDEGTPNEILASFDDRRRREYKLVKFFRTNQDTSITQRPSVKQGQRVAKGDVLADSSSTELGELALGRNVLVAFMPWRGYNFEDAIVISERVVSEDIYTSIHIEEFELHVRDTKRGEEELTREIPNVSEEATKDLDESGVIRTGAEVKEGDILIGKITPKGETDPTPEEKLLRAIFGDKAGDVKDASMKAPPGIKGVVVDTKLFSRKGLKKEGEEKREEKRRIDLIEKTYKDQLDDTNRKLAEKLLKVLDGETSIGVRDLDGGAVIRSGVQFKHDTFFSRLDEIERLSVGTDWIDDRRKMNQVRRIFEGYWIKREDIDSDVRRERSKVGLGDELQPGIMQMAKVYVAKKRKLSVGDKMAGRHGNKGVVAKIVPIQDMPFLADGTPVDLVLNPLGVPSRMNIGQLYETALGFAAKKLGVRFETPIFDGAHWSDVQSYLEESGLDVDARTELYDGRTGDKFDQRVTVGEIYMMKLSHLVDDKIHARSIGPYSLITQQPLGGKAQFGGQRFGEMEVWALEAYGAAHALQEILTVKSDDVPGRSKVYEAIVKGENMPEPSVPESFSVLVRELQGLGLEVRID
ncbi:MAG: DNA-directed RNA polymerase subunit beta [Bacteroidota bacterium]|nr:DNA-directed RNA polymerase subunit beta [Bacteroidota bacterium]MDP4232508.1 DNA-directed RNA polymerase subunit beta [Bacteroidota bacterium]MDP4241643.1 DNA-directed RNA polymerase subunit beta [Bacteroidota bacterium]MDP4286388.1 DNA-directed RNA polymerase subunit beta [Bacteroidota bacterium]